MHADHSLAALRRAELRTAFKAAVTAGEARPFLVPWSLIPTLVLPALYLSIPHTRRPWLYQARYLVAAAVVGLNLEMLWSTSSTNMATAYATGLCAAWGISWTLTVLVWMRPQFEAERVARRRRVPALDADGPGHKAADHASGGSNGHISSVAPADSEPKRRVQVQNAVAPDASVARSLEDGFEYYWQAFPADAPWLTRLDWAFDLSWAWRGSGWNFAIPSLPAFQRPEKPFSSELVRLDTIPEVSRSGFRRYASRGAFLRARALSISLGYLVLDLCGSLMRQDPYFVLGPTTHPLPPRLARLPPAALWTYRAVTALAGIVAALHMFLSLDQVVRRLLPRPAAAPRADLWHYPSVFGSLAAVADRGLAGFWGGWWHQSFRLAFAAPARWLVRRGLVPPGSPAARRAAYVAAFLQSGLLHAAGGVSSLPRATVWWQPPLFFLAQLAGVALQARVCATLGARLDALPRVCRRAGNLAFVAAWLLATQRLFIDDLSRAAIWLFEPVPVSVVSALGFAGPGDGAVWRWDHDQLPKWHWGKHWWETGLAI